MTVMLRKNTNQPDPGNQASEGFDVSQPLFPSPPKDHWGPRGVFLVPWLFTIHSGLRLREVTE